MKNKKPFIMYVHGALSTKLSWSYITTKLKISTNKKINEDFFEYDIKTLEGKYITNNLVDIIKNHIDSENINSKLILVGHSFGGLIAVEAARELKKNLDEKNIDVKIITTSTPFGGVHVPALLRILTPNSIFFKNISDNDSFIKLFKSKPLPYKTHSYITIGGTADWIDEPNDGIVTYRSQTILNKDPFIKQEFVDFNHFEILLTDIVIDHLINIL